MTSKQKKGLRSSIDDVLGDLLGDDEEEGGPVKVRSPPSVSSRAAAGLTSRSGKRSLLDDDFFSKLAEEAEKEDEGSDVSEADPAALLDSMKDMDDMDADLFGSKKRKPSSAPPQRRETREASTSADKTKSTEDLPEEKKPSSAPASTTRTYKKFSFLDDEGGGLHPPPPPHEDNADDSLDDLLDDLEQKEKKVRKNEPPSSSSPDAALRSEKERAAVKKRNELTFEEDGDLIDALGFGETHTQKEGATQKNHSDRPPRARTRLDEILGRGTSPRMLERPVTGEKKDTTQTEKKTEKQMEKSSAGKASVMEEDDLTFGSYQPTMGSTPEGRQSRRQSVRFSTEDVSAHSPEHKPKASSRSARPRSDWLGLKQEEESMKEEHTSPIPESLSTAASREERADPPTVPPSPKTGPNAAHRERDEDGDAWLSGALSRRRTGQSEDRDTTQEVTPHRTASGEEVDGILSSRSNVSSASRRRLEETPIPITEPISRESTGVSTQHNTSTDAPHKPVFQSQKSPVEGAVPVTHTPGPADTLQQLLIQQQLSQSGLWPLGGSLDSHTHRDLDHHPDVTSLQKRIIQLEAQVRSLQLERDQSLMLLESVQQRHKQDTELMENMHRARVKLLEDSASQRELRAQQENDDLRERLATHTRLMEQERTELQEQLQRRLTHTLQERDREVERLRELQRRSILEMKRDHEQQIQHLKKLKDEEIDAVTSATSHTRSLSAVIEQMELFSRRLGDLSSRVESSHEHTVQELESGARQRDEQLRVLQERLAQQQREMAEERTRLKEVIAKMDTQLAEQQRQMEKERWRVSSEQARADSSLRALEEERRTMMHQISMEREELDRAKSALLEEQQSVMQHCAEERRKLSSEWSRFQTHQKELQETHTHREHSILSLAQEQADQQRRSAELKQKQEQLQQEREKLEREREELEREKQKISSTALTLKTRAHDVEAFSQLASEKFEEGERALREARQVEAQHHSRLRSIHTLMERLREQEHSLQQERLRMTDRHRDVQRLRPTLPISPGAAAQPITDFSPALASTHLTAVNTQPAELHARLALIKHTAEKDRDFLQEEQYFLDTLKKTSYNFNT